MQTTPKSLRLHIGLVGRTNTGKSSLLNLLAGQDVAIVSSMPGTTTDVVEKPMELLPIGPVVFLDTAGLDDPSAIAELRLKKTFGVFDRADVIVMVCEPAGLGPAEMDILERAKERKLPVLAVINKTDRAAPAPALLADLAARCQGVIQCAATQPAERERVLRELKQWLLAVCPDEFLAPPPLVGDLVRPGGLVVLVVPIDLQAPKGRLILPQVQTIRDALDNDAAALVVKEREYAAALANLKNPPDLVVCDSQMVLKMVADTPPAVPCTTFSILFARLKGDLPRLAAGAAAVDRLRPGDRVLMAESCSHHPLEDDIGRVKIPRWLRQYAGADLVVDVVAGRDFPEDLGAYRLVVQCGGCMHNRREMLTRIHRAVAAGVPITNYGVCIAMTQGVLPRVLAPFPAALDAFRRAQSEPQPGAPP